MIPPSTYLESVTIQRNERKKQGVDLEFEINAEVVGGRGEGVWPISKSSSGVSFTYYWISATPFLIFKGGHTAI